MTNYRLKKYKVAYDLLVDYFEEKYKNNSVYYKNIEPYREKYNISYSEELTKIFVELENKYNIVENTNVDNVISKIVNRIKREKMSLSSFISRNMPNSKTIYLSFNKENIAGYGRKKKYWTDRYGFRTSYKNDKNYSKTPTPSTNTKKTNKKIITNNLLRHIFVVQGNNIFNHM